MESRLVVNISLVVSLTSLIIALIVFAKTTFHLDDDVALIDKGRVELGSVVGRVMVFVYILITILSITGFIIYAIAVCHSNSTDKIVVNVITCSLYFILIIISGFAVWFTCKNFQKRVAVLSYTIDGQYQYFKINMLIDAGYIAYAINFENNRPRVDTHEVIVPIDWICFPNGNVSFYINKDFKSLLEMNFDDFERSLKIHHM